MRRIIKGELQSKKQWGLANKVVKSGVVFEHFNRIADEGKVARDAKGVLGVLERLPHK